ncbi:MAG: type III secretion system chaperone [Gammaproteobacteria bacterium]
MQTDIEQVATLLEEFAHACDDVSALAGLPEASQWILRLRDESTIAVDYVREEARLCLSADLGTPLGAHRDSVYAAMLLAASLRATNGGISLALASPDEDCQVLIDVSTHELTPSRLTQACMSRHRKQTRAGPGSARSAQMTTICEMGPTTSRAGESSTPFSYAPRMTQTDCTRLG